jgi:hypothetical protein
VRAPADATAGLRLEAQPLLGIGIGLRARWLAPPGTAILGLRGIWAGTMLPGFQRQIGFEDGTGFRPLVATNESSLPTPVAAALPFPAPSVELRLICTEKTVANCQIPPPAWALLREVTITVADPDPPVARVGGPLVAPGWHRGPVALGLGGDDAGAGVERLTAEVDGAQVALAPQPCAAATIEGARRATAMRPCQATGSATVAVDTDGLPDGTDALRGCAVDFAGNVGCAPDVPVRIDNSAPSVAFAATQAGRVAATVFDPYSGPASGSLAMRPPNSDAWIDLPTEFRPDGPGKATLVAALPQLREGAYVFRAAAADGVGNAGAAELRVAGAPATIRATVAAAGEEHVSAAGAPGGRATRLLIRLESGGSRAGRRAAGATLTVPFGTAAIVRGRLVERGAGGAVSNRTLRVITRPSGGGRPASAIRPVTTDAHGRFALRLPPGPSRSVVVAFPGAADLAPSRSRALALRVRAGVSLAASPRKLRTGETVHLVGQVRRGGARIPGRGKLVAIQYLDRESRRWRPALVIRTGASGRFHADYRFRYITGTARIRLRATALPEAGWPYAAGSSPPVTVNVHGG